MSKQSSTGQKVARSTSAAVNIARGAAAGGVYGAAFEARGGLFGDDPRTGESLPLLQQRSGLAGQYHRGLFK